MTQVIEALVWAAVAYGGIGVVFAVAFVTAGVQSVDPDAKDGTTGFRLIILPGAAALWPLLLARWVGGVAHPPAERNAHRV